MKVRGRENDREDEYRDLVFNKSDTIRVVK